MISEKGFILENGTEMPFLGFGTYHSGCAGLRLSSH